MISLSLTFLLEVYRYTHAQINFLFTVFSYTLLCIIIIKINYADTSLQEKSQTFGDLAATSAGGTSALLLFILHSLVYTLIAGPPPPKKSRLHSDESTVSTDLSASQMLSQTDSASLIGPSSITPTHIVQRTDAATGLDAKLGMLASYS